MTCNKMTSNYFTEKSSELEHHLSPNWSESTASCFDLILPTENLNESLYESYISIIQCILEESTQNNSENFHTSFNSFFPPEISIKEYIERIHKYCSCDSESFIISLIYIDRITEKNYQLKLSQNNIHSFMVAIKFFEDRIYNNKFFADVGGIDVKEINVLEKEFLLLMNYDLSISEDIYLSYLKQILTFQNS